MKRKNIEKDLMTTQTKERFIQLLKEEIERCNLRIPVLSYLSGVSTCSINKFIKNERDLTFNEIISIAYVLKLDILKMFY